MNAMESVANFVAGMRYEEIPPRVVSEAKRAVIDCMGVSLAATADPSLAILRSFIAAMGGEPRSTLLTTRVCTSPAWAALYNGTLAHVLDFDDGSGLKTPLHPTAPVYATHSVLDAALDIVLTHQVDYREIKKDTK